MTDMTSVAPANPAQGPVVDLTRETVSDVLVILPVHKGWKYLDETVQSILTQDLKPLGRECLEGTEFTLHIIQNGEPDFDLTKYIRQLRKQQDDVFNAWAESCVAEKDRDLGVGLPPRWHIYGVHLYLANKGVALNHALLYTEDLSYQTLVFLCDADDLWHPGKVASQVRWMLEASPGVDVLGTRFQYMNAEGADLPGTPELPLGHKDIVEALDRGDNPVANSSVCYWGDLHKFGMYDPINKVEDYEWWKRLAYMGATFSNLGDVLMRHRIHKGSHFNGSRQQEVYKTFTDNCYKVHSQMRNVP